MILIISEEGDITTNDVIKWINFFSIPFKRISRNSKIEFLEIDMSQGITELRMEIEGEEVRFSDISKIWYRRSWFELDLYKSKTSDEKPELELNKQLYSEHIVLIDFFLDAIEKKSLNTQRTNDLSKLEVLEYCKALNILTPDTLVTTRKSKALEFLKKSGRVISKNISQGVFMNFVDHYLIGFTEEVTEADLMELPDKFAPMLFQNLIEKVFEIRTFYLDGTFYSSAIFSQNDKKTQLDFRNYNFDKPNRTPPFKLPNKIEKQLDELMKHFNINSGSIDLIYTKSNEYIFLEVNPIGQFSQVSRPCNYNLEKKVAEYLCLN